MDLHSMSYKMIQALAKENGIPANKKKKTLIKSLEKLVLGGKIENKNETRKSFASMPTLEPCSLETLEKRNTEETSITNETENKQNSPAPKAIPKEVCDKIEVQSISTVPKKEQKPVENDVNEDTKKNGSKCKQQKSNSVQERRMEIEEIENAEMEILERNPSEQQFSSKKKELTAEEEKNQAPPTSPKRTNISKQNNFSPRIKLKFHIDMEIDAKEVVNLKKKEFETEIMKQIRMQIQYQRIVEDAFQAAKTFNYNQKQKLQNDHTNSNRHPRVKRHLTTPRKSIREIMHHKTLQKKISKRRHSYCASICFVNRMKQNEIANRQSVRERAKAYAEAIRKKNKQHLRKKHNLIR